MTNLLQNQFNQPLSQFSLGDILSKEFPETEWLIEGLIPNAGITCITGKPAVGKSYITLYLAQMIATGQPFLDQFSTSQQSVCVLTKEDPQRLIQKRIKALKYEDNLPIVFCDDMSAFCNTDEELTRIQKLLADNSSTVLIVDSFIRVVGGDENLSKDVTKVHEVFKKLTQQGITIIFTHHQGKEDNGKAGIDKPRGSSDIGAMVDSLLNFSKRDGVITVDHAKSRWDQTVGTFAIQFPSFIGNDCAFKFLGYFEKNQKDEVISSTQKAMDDILEIVQNSLEPIHQAGIIKILEDNEVSYSPGTIKIALDRMDTVQLTSFKEGGKKYFSLKVPENQASSQPTNSINQLPAVTDDPYSTVSERVTAILNGEVVLEEVA